MALDSETAAPAPDVVHAPYRGAHEPHGAWSPALHPDGHGIAYVDDRDGQPGVWVRPVGPGRARRLGTGPHPVLAVSWSRDGAWLAALVAPGGSPRTQVLVVRPDGSRLRRVAGDERDAGFLGSWTAQGLLAVSEAAAPGETDAFLVHPGDGSRRRLATGGLLVVLDVSTDGSRALLRSGPRGHRVLEVVEVATGDRRPLPGLAGPGSSDLGWLSPDGCAAWVRSDAGRERAALLRVDLGPAGWGSATSSVVAERLDAELDDAAVSDDRGTAVLLWNCSGLSETEVIDLPQGRRRDPRELPRPVAGSATLSADGSRLAVALEGPEDAPDVWVTDLEHWSWRRPRRRPRRRAAAFLPTLEELRAGDGMPLSGWLYRARTVGPGPAVVHLHGGPEYQERPRYQPLYQELAARGISVFAPNVRGSTGFGRTFLEADDRDRRFAAVSDVADCVERLVELGVAEQRRIAVMGRSYGGYLTLNALVTYPELFAAGVDVCGMVDLETFYERTEPWMADASYPEYGHPVHDRELLRALSPIHRMHRLAAPLLVVHGANDTNVPVHESDQVVAAARAHGVPVQYLLFDGEGHDLVRAENRATELNATVDFLVATLSAVSPRRPRPRAAGAAG